MPARAWIRIGCAVAAMAGGSPALAALGIAPAYAFFLPEPGISVGTVADDGMYTITGSTLTQFGWNGNELLPGHMDIRISNNGAVIWNSNSLSIGYNNANGATTFLNMPPSHSGITGNGDGTHMFIAPLWDDYVPSTTKQTSIKWQVFGSDLFIEWSNEAHQGAAGGPTCTFEMIVYGGTGLASGNALVSFHYLETALTPPLQDGAGATIGFKNWGVNPQASDVEYGIGGGDGTTFNPGVPHPKVCGYNAGYDQTLPNAVYVYGGVPAPGTAGVLMTWGILAMRRRRGTA